MPLLGLAGGSARLGRAQGGVPPTPPSNALAMVPEGWVEAVDPWDNPGSLTPTGWTISENTESSLATSGYPSSPYIGGPAVRQGTWEAGAAGGGGLGRIGCSVSATAAMCFVHHFIIPGTDGVDSGYPYSWVNGGNKVTEMNPIGSGRAYTVWRAQVPFDTEGSNYREMHLALQGFSPVEGLAPTGSGEGYEVVLNEWMTTTVILDNRLGDGAGIARYYLQIGDGDHVLQNEHTTLTFPGSTWTNCYMEHTNNGRTGSIIPFEGSLFDAYLGVFVPPGS